MHASQEESDKCRTECDKVAYHLSDDIIFQHSLTPAIQGLIDTLLTDAANLIGGY